MAGADVIEFPSCTVDLRTEQILREGETVVLTSREAELLRFLIAHPQQVLSREDLLEEVWGYSRSVVSRAADATIHRLRQKLEADATRPQHIIKVHGVGYRYEPPASSKAEAPAGGDPGEAGGDRWTPEGVASGDERAAAYWQSARELAEQHGHGFVGVEHLLMALDGVDGGGVHTSTARRMRLAGRALSRLGNLSVAAGERTADWRGTPRLRSLEGLSPGHALEEIWTRLLLNPNRGVQGLDLEGDGPGLSTPARWGRAPAEKLEVVGGPEDGRCVQLHSGEKLGRWWPGRSLDHGLYQECFVEDPSLSRSGALIWHDGGQVELSTAGSVLRWSTEAMAPGATRSAAGDVLPRHSIQSGETIALVCGDLLFPTPGTSLRAIR